MPAKSKKQQKFMAAVANNPKFAKKVGVPQDVGEEFMKMKKYQKGGMSMGMGKGEGKFPDLTGDGKVTKADILKGRGVNKMKKSSPKKMKEGGKVRGCGKATKGVRSAKMVSMKGS